MARYSSGDGKLRVTYTSSVSNTAAPTTTELNAGTNLSSWLTKDGIEVPSDQNMVDDSSLADTFDAQVVGSFGGAIKLTAKRDGTPANDTAWNLITYGLTGFIVIRRGVASGTAWTVGDKVEVYPVMFHEPLPMTPASNEQSKFSATAAVTAQPNLKATVA